MSPQTKVATEKLAAELWAQAAEIAKAEYARGLEVAIDIAREHAKVGTPAEREVAESIVLDLEEAAGRPRRAA